MSIKGYAWQEAPNIKPRMSSSYIYVIEKRKINTSAISHDQWVIDYSFTGGADVKAGKQDNDWTMRLANQAHLYSPHTKYWERLHEPTRAGYIMFSGGDVAGLTRLTQKNGYARINDISGEIGQRITNIAELGFELGENAYWEVQSIFIRIIGLLLAAAKDDTGFYSVGGEEKATQSFPGMVMSYIRKNYDRKITLDEVAKNMHVSKSTLTHKFRRETGTSPMQALLETRLGIARIMLLRGEKIDAIADKIGFYDAFHMSKAFKKHYGVTPSAMRRKK